MEAPMPEEEQKQTKERLPHFNVHRETIIHLLAAMPVRLAVDAFLAKVPHLLNEKYGTAEEIRKIVTKRFYEYKTRCWRTKIEETKQKFQGGFLAHFPYSNPIEILVELYELYFNCDRVFSKVRLLRKIWHQHKNMGGVDGIPAARSGRTNFEKYIQSLTFAPTPIDTAHRNIGEKLTDVNEEEREKERLPHFNVHRETIIHLLAAMPVRLAVDAFLAKVPHLLNEKYGTAEEIRKIVTKRFYEYKTRCWRTKIEETKQKFQGGFLAHFPYSNPIEILVELYELYFNCDRVFSKVRLLRKIWHQHKNMGGVDGIPAARSGKTDFEKSIEGLTFEPTPIGTAHRNIGEKLADVKKELENVDDE